MTLVDTWHLDLALVGAVVGAVAVLAGRRARLPVAPTAVVAGAGAIASADVPAPLPALALGALLVVATTARRPLAPVAWIGAGALVVAASPQGTWAGATVVVTALAVVVAVLGRPDPGAGAAPTEPAEPSGLPVIALVAALIATWTHVPDTEGIVALGAATAVVVLAHRAAAADAVPAATLVLLLVVAHDSRGRPASMLAVLSTTALVVGAVAVADRARRPPPAVAVVVPAALTLLAARTVGIAPSPRPLPGVALTILVVSWWLATAWRGRGRAARAAPGKR